MIEAQLDDRGGLGGGASASLEECCFVLSESSLDVVRMCGDGLGELCSVEQDQVGALAVGRREMSRVSSVTPGTRCQQCASGSVWMGRVPAQSRRP